MKFDHLYHEIKESNNNRRKIMPHREALYVTVWYVVLGALWILFSDTLVNTFIKNTEVIKVVQLLKGWFYVIITGIYIYVLIYLRIKLLRSTADQVYDSYRKLGEANEELALKEEEIYALSNYDRMTNLLNWNGLANVFDQYIDPNKSYVMFYIDIDNIKHVNDTLGHDQGNVLLEKVAEKLNRYKKENDIIARLSGDEFLLLQPFDNTDMQLHKQATQLVNHLRIHWKIDKYEFFVTASVGIAKYPEHGKSLDLLIKNSDAAMFQAKDLGKDQHYLYNQSISKRTENYVEVISQIRHGINNEEFVLYYQPIVKMGSKELVAVEALIRWEHPERGFLTPYHFIEIAERSGQINEIGKWVFKSACQQIHTWQSHNMPPTKVSVNLSGIRLFAPELIDDIKEAMELYQVDPKYIQVEITETTVMENLNRAIKILEEIRALGISIALDDFGTGYSSLTYLQIFPIDVLKIDKEFIKNISVEGMEKENNIINAVINLGHSLELEIVAEGIEESEQSEYLMINDCDYGQGYYFDKPIPVEEFEEKYLKLSN